MTDIEASQPPPRPSGYRLGHLTSFITLNDDASTPSSWSTRGQRLPSLIQSRSSTNLFRSQPSDPNLFSRRGTMTATRRRTSISSTEDDEALTMNQRQMERTATSYFDVGAPGGSIRDSVSVERERSGGGGGGGGRDPRRESIDPELMFNNPAMRSMRLIGKSNPRYRWGQYWKTDEELKAMRKPIREYYERCNFLVSSYVYIDRLLDSSLPHDLIMEYQARAKGVQGGGWGGQPGGMATITEETPTATPMAATPKRVDSGSLGAGAGFLDESANGSAAAAAPAGISPEHILKRTPKNLYKVPEHVDERSPLLSQKDAEDQLDDAIEGDEIELPEDMKFDDGDADVDSDSPVVTVAIYVNLVANILLLIGKIAVIVLTSSLSVLASLVDAVLDFLSTAIVWTTTKLISHNDQYAYPIGRRRLEPVGVLVFSVIMITSFFQVALECVQRLMSPDHSIVQLGVPAIAIMLSTVLIKGFCWFWCRLVRNSSVQALAQDAITDVVFNTFSIIFPLVGYYTHTWWLDATGGLLLSFYVIFQWSRTSATHVRNLCGAAADRDQRNILLYLTMRFAKTIRKIQGLQAYHTGDKLNVEVDIVLDENTNLRDSHDLSESLQYVLESVPYVDRAFVHADYAEDNLASHMDQQAN